MSRTGGQQTLTPLLSSTITHSKYWQTRHPIEGKLKQK